MIGSFLFLVTSDYLDHDPELSGGGPAPAEAYEVYSALYKAPMQEPLAIAEGSLTDIPQVNGSCLRAATSAALSAADAVKGHPNAAAIEIITPTSDLMVRWLPDERPAMKHENSAAAG